MTANRNRRLAAILAVLIAWGLSSAPVEAADRSKHPGFVDGRILIDLAGEEALTVEISLHGALLKALSKTDEELERMAGGLESIQAVIVDLNKVADAPHIEKMIDGIRRDLEGDGWQRLARINEDESVIHVLVLSDEETIQGLVVLVVDREDDQVIFANVAGTLDLAALEKLGEELDIPGLDDLD